MQGAERRFFKTLHNASVLVQTQMVEPTEFESTWELVEKIKMVFPFFHLEDNLRTRWLFKGVL